MNLQERFLKIKELLKVPYYAIASAFHPETSEEIQDIIEIVIFFAEEEYLDPTNPLIEYSIKNEFRLFTDLAIYAIPIKESTDLGSFINKPYFRNNLFYFLNRFLEKGSFVALGIYLRCLFRSLDLTQDLLDEKDFDKCLTTLVITCISVGSYDIIKEAFQNTKEIKTRIAEKIQSYFNSCFALPVLPNWYVFPEEAVVSPFDGRVIPLLSSSTLKLNNPPKTLDDLIIARHSGIKLQMNEVDFQDSCMFWGMITNKDTIEILSERALVSKKFNGVSFLYHALRTKTLSSEKLMGSRYLFATLACDMDDEEKIQVYADNYKRWIDVEEIAAILTDQNLGYQIYRVRNKERGKLMTEKQYIRSRKDIVKFPKQRRLPRI